MINKLPTVKSVLISHGWKLLTKTLGRSYFVEVLQEGARPNG